MLQIYLFVSDKYKYAGYATVCIVCLKRITEVVLQKCSGCKLVFYCSKEHQKLHWPEHKQLCKAVQLMIKRTDNVGLFDDYVDEGGFALWDRFRMSLRYICESLLKRKLDREESALFLNPFACKICHLHKNLCMITCPKCSVVVYCSEEHKNKDKVQHALICDKLKCSLDYDTACKKNFCVRGFVKDVKVLPTDMEDFIDKNVDIKTEPYVDKLYTGWHLSNSLTIPLTLIYIIEKSKIFEGKEKLRIHVVGSGPFENGACWCWEYVFHYFNRLQSLDLVFIGPESSHQFLPPVLMCQNCKNSRSINFCVESSLYKDYKKNNTVVPDIIIAFNCGFHEFVHLTKYDTWKDSFDSICSFRGAVVAFTSYLEDECRKDLQALQKFSKNENATILVKCQENPYRSLIPFHDFYNETGSVYFNNNFITILTT